MQYYFVKVAENTYDVYSKETNEKVNIAKRIADRFADGQFKDKK